MKQKQAILPRRGHSGHNRVLLALFRWYEIIHTKSLLLWKCAVKVRECDNAIVKVVPLFPQHRGSRSCVECQGGKLCNQTGLSQALICPTGHYCPPGSSVARPCPPVSIWFSCSTSAHLWCIFLVCYICCHPSIKVTLLIHFLTLWLLRVLTLTRLGAMLCCTVGHARLVGSVAGPVSLSLRASVIRDTTAPLEPPLPLQ